MEAESQPAPFPAEDLARLTIEARKRSEVLDNQPLREEQRLVTGMHEIFGEIYRGLAFDKHMGARRIAVERNLFHTVMDASPLPLRPPPIGRLTFIGLAGGPPLAARYRRGFAGMPNHVREQATLTVRAIHTRSKPNPSR